jgi:hypothetical protein
MANRVTRSDVRLGLTTSALLACLLGAACAADGGTSDGSSDGAGGKADSSIDAVVLNFRFKSEFLVDTSGSRMVQNQIEEQLFYTVGQLNGDRSVGRLDKLEVLSETRTREAGRVRVRYEARLPVAWGKLRSVPEKYELVLPADMSLAAQEAFTKKYKTTCVDEDAHDVDVDSMWYYYRPDACEIAAQDVVRVQASVTRSRVNTTGKYPEYDKIWEDGELRVVSIYGKDNKDAKTAADVGIASYNGFVAQIFAEYEGDIVASTPAKVPERPGINVPDVEFSAILADGRRLHVASLLVDEVSSAPDAFFERYAVLSERADLILYNGHSGLGANIQTLAWNGSWVPGQYVIVYMNGCDSYAYVDSALADAHAAINDDDPNGTKYLDILMNALPAPFGIEDDPTPHLIRALLQREDPMSYAEIFKSILRDPIVLVSGEEDNRFRP